MGQEGRAPTERAQRWSPQMQTATATTWAATSCTPHGSPLASDGANAHLSIIIYLNKSKTRLAFAICQKNEWPSSQRWSSVYRKPWWWQSISSISAADVPVKFFNWLAAWLTLYDQKVFLRDKVEGIQAAGPLISNVDHAEEITDSNTVEINVLRAQTSIND